MLKQWYDWIENHIDSNISNITKHRASFPPWFAPPTSHLIKKTGNKKRKWKNLNLNRTLKLKSLEREIEIATSNDLANYEAEVCQTRQFNNIQNYLASIRKQPNVPPIVDLGNTRSESDREKI